jgi:hypothetical protein
MMSHQCGHQGIAKRAGHVGNPVKIDFHNRPHGNLRLNLRKAEEVGLIAIEQEATELLGKADGRIHENKMFES